MNIYIYIYIYIYTHPGNAYIHTDASRPKHTHEVDRIVNEMWQQEVATGEEALALCCSWGSGRLDRTSLVDREARGDRPRGEQAA